MFVPRVLFIDGDKKKNRKGFIDCKVILCYKLPFLFFCQDDLSSENFSEENEGDKEVDCDEYEEEESREGNESTVEDDEDLNWYRELEEEEEDGDDDEKKDNASSKTIM